MNVLSLFDGISCAYVALQRAGIKVNKYYASEIDKNAIAISKKNISCRLDLGDVREIKSLDDTIDLLVGGSPCQDLSIAKKGRMGLAGNRSSLFWEYVRIKELVKPKYFILENVASMPKADKDTITKTLGVEPIMINAALVSAQSRKRLFWTNIPNVQQPEDRGILLKDILQPDAEVDERMVVDGKSFCLTATYSHANTTEAGIRNSVEKKQRTLVKTGAAIRGRQNETGEWVQTLDTRDDEKANALTQSHSGKLALVRTLTLLEKPKEHEFTQIGYFGDKNASGVGGQGLRVYTADGKSTASGVGLYKVGHIGNDDAQANRVYSAEGKSATLSANGGGLGAKTGLYKVGYIEPNVQGNRVYSAEGKSATLSANSGGLGANTGLYVCGRDMGRRLNEDGHREDNNKDIPIQRRIETRDDGKSSTLTSVMKDNLLVNEFKIRKLTPIECERLQGLPDNYTEGIAMTNRYKALGNAFNVDVVAHILKSVLI